MAWSTVKVVLTTSLATGNTTPVNLTLTLPTSSAQDGWAYIQSVYKNGGVLTDSNHFIPVTAIQYLEVA